MPPYVGTDPKGFQMTLAKEISLAFLQKMDWNNTLVSRKCQQNHHFGETQLRRYGQNPMKIYIVGYPSVPISRNTEIDEHLEEIAKNLIVEHPFYTIYIATNNRTPVIFFHCVNSQTRIVKRVWLYIRDTGVRSTAKNDPWLRESAPKYTVVYVNWVEKVTSVGAHPKEAHIWFHP